MDSERWECDNILSIKQARNLGLHLHAEDAPSPIPTPSSYGRRPPIDADIARSRWPDADGGQASGIDDEDAVTTPNVAFSYQCTWPTTTDIAPGLATGAAYTLDVLASDEGKAIKVVTCPSR